MSNRNRRGARRRVTGRFYVFAVALVTILVLAVVFVRPGQTPAVEGFDPVLQTQTAEPSAGPSAELRQTEEPEPTEEPAIVVPESEKIDVGDQSSDLSVRTDLPAGVRNILLLGTDSRDMSKIARCDTIIIASVNTGTGVIKLCSVMRDMMIGVPGSGMKKIGEVTQYGKGDDGPRLLMKLINENLGMNITEYALVNFAGMSRIIDILNGVYIPSITQEEMEEINRHMGEVAMADGKLTREQYLEKRGELHLKTWGNDMLLHGYAAVSYARIRQLDSDYTRTERQRTVIEAIANRVKGASAGQMAQLAMQCWGDMQTNIDLMSAAGLASSVLKTGLTLDDKNSRRIPFGKDGVHYASKTENGIAALYDVDYAYSRQTLHKFIYGEAFD